MKQILTNHQEEIVNNILLEIEECITLTNPIDKFVELNGAAGVGKTFSTIHIVKELRKNKRVIAFAAPTHAAVSVIKKINKETGKDMFLGTIHSFLELVVENDLDTGEKIIKSSSDSLSNKCDILIIDEKSMLCQDILDKIYHGIRQKAIKAVLLIGDGYQLPCVNGTPPKKFPNFHELTEIVRQQKNSPIIKLSSTVRQSIEDKEYPSIDNILKLINQDIKIFENENEFLNHYYNVTDEENDKIIGAYENVTVNQYNSKIFNTLHPNSEYVEKGFSFILQNTNNTFFEDKWIHTHNNGEKIYIDKVKKITYQDLYSADLNKYELRELQLFEKQVLDVFEEYEINMQDVIGEVEYYYCKDTEQRTIIILSENSEIRLKYILDTLKENALAADSSYERKQLFRLFFNLRKLFANVKYSYSNTFHKLQGSTYKHVGIDIRSIENNSGKPKDLQDTIFRLLYVGITRASDTLFILRNKPVLVGGILEF